MSLKTITITRWFNNNTNKKYSVDVYEDDNIENGISKIGLTIAQEIENKNLGRFYVWNNNYPDLLYSIDNIKWKGYNSNPLKSTDRNNLIIKQPIIYNFNYGLCYFNKLNIIYENDFPDLKDNQYYFIDKKLASLDSIKKNEKKLTTLEKIDTSAISVLRYNIHRYELTSKLSKNNFLANIYDKLNTNHLIQYIQWVNDTYTLIHKLYLYHNINHSQLNAWTTIDKINNVRCINCFSLLGQDTNSFVKITINNDMKIDISYIIDLRKNISWEMIQTNLNNIKKYLESSLTTKITFTPTSIKVYNYVSILNVPLTTLKNNISLYPQIFEIISSKESINLVYKRCSNYSNEIIDYSKYIKTRLLLGIDNEEIIEELITFGFKMDEAKQLLLTEVELLNELDQNMLKEDFNERRLNTIVVIKVNKNGFEIIIHNIPNKKELDYLIFWLSKIISSSQEKQKEIKKKAIMVKESSSSSSSSNKDDEELKLSFSSSSSTGGAKNKDKDDQRYRIQLLQTADKELFGENYAREKCQKRNQPFVISAEARQKLIDEGKYNVDNDLYYGSKKDKMNYYICPRLWCKVGKVPADPITGKCPTENDETILSFFDNPDETDVKRYVKLIKPNENNICAPCCFKKPPKANELNKCKNYETYDPKNIAKENIDEKDENYLVNYSAPIAIGRYGIVPQQIHEILFPSIPFQNCSKDLSKSEKCIVRKGIVHKDISKEINIYPDSLIYALSYLLDFNGNEEKKQDIKKMFIRDIKKKLDLLTFLTIENGNVCKAFMDKIPLIPDDNLSLIVELKQHFDSFPFLKKLYKIDYTNFNYKLSRSLAIFKSYNKFIDYLQSNDYHIHKSPYYLYSLISNIYNKLLIVWEKEKKGNTTNIICPYYTSYNDLIASMEINPEIIMLLKDKKYFEPLEIKSKGKEGNKILILNDYPKLQLLLKECSTNSNYDDNYNIYQNLYSLNTWIKTKILDNYQKFIITTVIINSDLTIEHFLTKGNLLITIKKIGINLLNRIIKDFDISSIVFYDDLSESNTTFNINVSVRDLERFKEKVIPLDIKYDIGTLDKSIKQREPVAEVYTILEIKKNELNNTNIIHTRIKDDLYYYNKNNDEDNKKWFQLQMMVFSTIINKITEEQLKEFLSMTRIDYINELLKLFPKNPNKNKIRIIIEEIPIYSINHIKNYLNKLIMYYKYDLLNPIININNPKNQFQFSQVALNNGIPYELLSYHKSTPNNNFIKSAFLYKDFNFDVKNPEPEINLPVLFKGKLTPLNSKWIMHKKSKWSQMETIKIEDYSKNDFKEFFNWLAVFIGIKTNFDNLQEITNNKLRNIRNDEENIKTILKDIKLFKLMTSITGKVYKNVNLYWDNVYVFKTNTERLQIMNDIIKKGYPLNDLYILSMCEILNINILTIHRAIYNTANDKNIRGDLEDLFLSTTLYKAPINHLNRPFIIFNKIIISETNETSYQLVVDKTIPLGTKSIYLKLSDVPQEIMRIVNEHLKSE